MLATAPGNRWVYLGIGAVLSAVYLASRRVPRDPAMPPPAPTISLRQAQKEFGHPILVPQEIPSGFRLAGAKATRWYHQPGPPGPRPRPGRPTRSLGVSPGLSPRTAPYPMAYVFPCSPAEMAGIYAGDRLLAMGDGAGTHSLAGLSFAQLSALGQRLRNRLRGGGTVSITYQHEDSPPRTWRARLPEPYRPCFDRPPAALPTPRIAALIYTTTDGRGSFSVVEQETRDNPFVMRSADLGIDIGQGRRLHFAPSSLRSNASWEQDGLWIQILDPKGLLTRSQALRIARSMR